MLHSRYSVSNQSNDHLDILLYRSVFDVFDHDGSGFIDPNDLHEIALSLHKDPEQGMHHHPVSHVCG